MKKILLLVCLFVANYCFAQWTQLTVPTTANIVSSSFINDDEGWIGTTNSGQAYIYHTNDGGLTWNTITVSGGTNGASYVCFVNPTTGYAVVNTIAVKTTDGGLTWDPLVMPAIPYYEPFFLNEDTGFIGGSHQIFKTTDGGQSWASYPIIGSGPFYSMDFFSDEIGSGCGYDDYPYATFDAGENWEIVDDGGLWSYFFAVSYKPDGHFYYTGYEDIFGDVTYFIRGQNDYYSQETDYLYALHWFDNDTGYAAGKSGYVVYTEDGGLVWNELQLPALFGLPNKTLNCIDGFEDVYIFGEGGYSFKLPGLASCTLAADYSYTVDELGVQFTDQTPTSTDWSWDFGDGTTSTDQDPFHTYTSDGLYHACLFASNDTCPAGYADCKDIFICTSNLSQNPGGTLDSTFGGDGIVTNIFDGYYQECHSAAVQPDHKILALDFGYGSELTRYNTDGTPDSTFDDDGIFELESDYEGQFVKSNSSGKILISGDYSGDEPMYIVCLNSDGSYDPSFGTNGILLLDPTPGATNDNLIDMEIQPDDKIVLLSHFSSGSNEFTTLTRLDPDGSLDLTFDGNGVAALASNDFQFSSSTIGALLIQPDGAFVIAGITNHPQTKIAVARMNADGSTDVSFDTDGVADVDITTDSYKDYAVDVVCQPDGKVVVAGNTTSDMVILRFNVDGSLDPTFDADGILILNPFGIPSEATGIDLQPDEKILVLGDIDFSSAKKIMLARLNPDGTYDSSFGNGGYVTTSINCLNTNSFDLVLDEAEIYVGGSSNDEGFCVFNYKNTSCSPLTALFSFNAVDLTIQFTDQTIGSTSWQWNFGDGVISTDQNPSHTYALPGSYQVCLIASNDCSVDTICQLITIIATSIPSSTENLSWEIFPNPFNESTTIQFSLEKNTAIKMELFDISGKMLKTIVEGSFTKGYHEVTLTRANIGAGIYFLQLTTSTGINQEKIIIE